MRTVSTLKRRSVFSVIAASSLLVWGAVVLSTPGCGATTPLTGDAEADADASAGDAPFEMRGPYRCCATGTGTSCCAGLPREKCQPYGGAYGDCRHAGESYEAKVICSKCCDGLVRVPSYVVGDADPPSLDQLPAGCDLGAPPSILTCIACGDGVCGTGESFCNCPADCDAP